MRLKLNEDEIAQFKVVVREALKTYPVGDLFLSIPLERQSAELILRQEENRPLELVYSGMVTRLQTG